MTVLSVGIQLLIFLWLSYCFSALEGSEIAPSGSINFKTGCSQDCLISSVFWQRQGGGFILWWAQHSSFPVKGEAMVINAVRFLLRVAFLALGWRVTRTGESGPAGYPLFIAQCQQGPSLLHCSRGCSPCLGRGWFQLSQPRSRRGHQSLTHISCEPTEYGSIPAWPVCRDAPVGPTQGAVGRKSSSTCPGTPGRARWRGLMYPSEGSGWFGKWECMEQFCLVKSAFGKGGRSVQVPVFTCSSTCSCVWFCWGKEREEVRK